jgi:hypothetical protein
MSVCYICMEGESAGELRRKSCLCRTLVVHRACLCRELDSNIARDPLRCRVCSRIYQHSIRNEYGPEMLLWGMLSAVLFVDQCVLLMYAHASLSMSAVLMLLHVLCTCIAAPWVAQPTVVTEVRTWPLLNAVKQPS